jgi:hemolysin activation/secretion protein
MYRIGGLRTLRGFSEEVLFATTYSVASFEYRYLFEENSAVYLFTDAAWYEKTGTTNYVRDTPLGFGAGVNFETKSGIFTFNYALGSEFNNPILVRNAKISFGFRNVF